MALFKFKKKKKIEKEKKKEAPKPKEIKEEKKTEEAAPKKKAAAHKGINVAPFILKSPHIAEKSTEMMKINQYVFKVYPRANKTEIKKAVEEVYGVDVLKVNIVKLPKKRRTVGKSRGWRQGCKKAIVKIKKGQEIELLPR